MLLLMLLLVLVKALLLVLIQRILLNVLIIISSLARVGTVRSLVGTLWVAKGLEAKGLVLGKILGRILLVRVISPDRVLRVAWHLNQVFV
jgi:hypothetical protein